MDLTHGSVICNDEELLADVPVYISSDANFVHWSGCLHLHRKTQLDFTEGLAGKDYRIRLRDGRLGSIRIRKVISTNGASHVEVLFEGASPLRESA